jgi:hypothetical protein
MFIKAESFSLFSGEAKQDSWFKLYTLEIKVALFSMISEDEVQFLVVTYQD